MFLYNNNIANFRAHCKSMAQLQHEKPEMTGASAELHVD